jgi:hypothetical protein
MSKLVTSSEMNNWTAVRNNRGETIILMKFRYEVLRLERLLVKHLIHLRKNRALVEIFTSRTRNGIVKCSQAVGDGYLYISCL